MGSLLEPLLPLVKFQVQQLLRLKSSSCLLLSTAPVSCQVYLLPLLLVHSCFCLLSRTLPTLAKCPSCLMSRVTSVMGSSCLLPSTTPVSCHMSHLPPTKCPSCLLSRASCQVSPPTKCPSRLQSSIPPVSGQVPLPLFASVPPVSGQVSLLSTVKRPSCSLQVSLLSSVRCHSASCPARYNVEPFYFINRITKLK
jgi:hypothetical protein